MANNAHAKTHPYHLVDPSPWPFFGSMAALWLAVMALLYMHPEMLGEGAAATIRGFGSWKLIVGLAPVLLVTLLALFSEYAGVLGPMVGAPRRYDGPMGKSDRALVFGALALAVGLLGGLPGWTFWLLPIIDFAIFTNIVNRVRNGVRAARCVATHSHSTHSDTAQTAQT